MNIDWNVILPYVLSAFIGFIGSMIVTLLGRPKQTAETEAILIDNQGKVVGYYKDVINGLVERVEALEMYKYAYLYLSAEVQGDEENRYAMALTISREIMEGARDFQGNLIVSAMDSAIKK